MKQHIFGGDSSTPYSTDRADLRSLSGTISGNVRLTCMFASFAFLQFITLGLANHAGEDFLNTGQREHVYYVLQVFVILGFLLHAFFAGLFVNTKKGPGIRRGISYTVFVLYFACAAVMLLTGTDSMFYVIVSVMASLLLGWLGGLAHVHMSRETLTGADVAKCMGIGSAVSVVLQYLLQIRCGVSPLLPVFVLAAFLLLAYTLSGKHQGSAEERAVKTEKTPPRQILFAILITTAFVLFACFYNEYIHHLQIQSDYGAYNVYSWPRLMMVPGYLLFAAVGDRKNGRYVPLSSLCVMLVAMLNVVLIHSPGSHWLNMCLFYLAIAACASYYLLTFWRLAPGTEHPALWAPFGRIIDSGMVLLAGGIHLSALPAPVILGMDIAGVVLIILLMAVSGSFNIGEQPAEIQSEEAGVQQITSEPLSEEEVLDRMRQRYNLTRRETEVLRELVLTEDKQTVISERLSIKVKTLQDYVTRLYRKTGAVTRAGLTALYNESRNQT